VQEDDGPARGAVLLQNAFGVGALLLGDPVALGFGGVFRTQQQEQHAAVQEVVVAPAELLVPQLLLGRVAEVVVAGDVEEGHLQLGDVALEFFPLLGQLAGVGLVAFDQVAHGEDELGLEQVQLLDGEGKDPGPVAAGPVADDGELEVGGVVVKAEVVPGVGGFLVDLQVGRRFLPDGKGDGGGQQTERGGSREEAFHGFGVLGQVAW
jgi:hypothetical protein